MIKAARPWARSGEHDRFIELHQKLLALIAPELRKALRGRRYSDVLSFISLLKRSVSTVAACRMTLEAVRDPLRAIKTETAESQESRKQRLRTLRELNRNLERFGTVSTEQETEQQTLEVEDLAQQLIALEREVGSEARHIRRFTSMADALDELIRDAESAAGQDPKLSTAIAQVQTIRATEPRAKILIYTEYSDSQAALIDALQAAEVGPVITMSGEDDEKPRTTATNRFRTEDNLVLVSIDAAAEGLNLHQRCHHLLHLELPFNPALDEHWQFVRRKLRNLVAHGGGLRVQNHVIEPLLSQLGYTRVESAEDVQTREGSEAGGALLLNGDPFVRLRVWCVDLDADLDAPARRGLAYRFSHTRIAQRVLLTTGERLGVLTNGIEIRLLISDPARVDSQVAISIDPHWKRSRDLPDSVRLLIALASPAGVKALPALIDKARLQQAKVTKDLREQARHAIREFIQELLDQVWTWAPNATENGRSG